MKAIVQTAYGSPTVLELKEIDRPVVNDGGVLVRVHAAAPHAGDYFVMRGVPYAVRFVAGKVQPGQKVLINGAPGGVGTFAVQTAKSFGAEVTGVCSTRNLGVVRSIGADHVIDYTRLVRSAFVRQQGRPFLSMANGEDLVVLKKLIETGKLTPVIDRTYRLSETPEALGYVGEGHARGKVVITLGAALERWPAVTC